MNIKHREKNIVDKLKRNEELISKYQNNEISRYELKLISNHYGK